MTLEEQILAAALIVEPMQRAWEGRGDVNPDAAGVLSPEGCMFRGVLVGGGGCGKTRLVNNVIVPLVKKPWQT